LGSVNNLKYYKNIKSSFQSTVYYSLRSEITVSKILICHFFCWAPATLSNRKINVNKRRHSVSHSLSLSFGHSPFSPPPATGSSRPCLPPLSLEAAPTRFLLQTLPTPLCCRQLAHAGRRATAVSHRASSILVVGEPEEAPETRGRRRLAEVQVTQS
jgi:hypothetical protein